MNYPTLKIEYLRNSKDSVFFDSVQRGDIATSAQLQSRTINNKRSHSDFKGNLIQIEAVFSANVCISL